MSTLLTPMRRVVILASGVMYRQRGRRGMDGSGMQVLAEDRMLD